MWTDSRPYCPYLGAQGSNGIGGEAEKQEGRKHGEVQPTERQIKPIKE